MKIEKLQQMVLKVIDFSTKQNFNTQFIKSQPHYSEDEDYFNQNQYQNKNVLCKNSIKKIDQSDVFEDYMN